MYDTETLNRMIAIAIGRVITGDEVEPRGKWMEAAEAARIAQVEFYRLRNEQIDALMDKMRGAVA